MCLIHMPHILHLTHGIRLNHVTTQLIFTHFHGAETYLFYGILQRYNSFSLH